MEDKQMKKMIDNFLMYFPLFLRRITTVKTSHKARSTAYYEILGTLNHHKSMSMSELGKYLLISPPNMTSLVNKLVDERKVERIYDENDRRVVKISITPKGTDFIMDSKEIINEHILNTLTQLNNEELEELYQCSETLKRIIFSMEGH